VVPTQCLISAVDGCVVAFTHTHTHPTPPPAAAQQLPGKEPYIRFRCSYFLGAVLID